MFCFVSGHRIQSNGSIISNVSLFLIFVTQEMPQGSYHHLFLIVTALRPNAKYSSDNITAYGTIKSTMPVRHDLSISSIATEIVSAKRYLDITECMDYRNPRTLSSVCGQVVIGNGTKNLLYGIDNPQDRSKVSAMQDLSSWKYSVKYNQNPFTALMIP